MEQARRASLLRLPALCLVTDIDLAGGAGELVRAVTEAVTGGVNMVQVRSPGVPAEDIIELSSRIKDSVAGRATIILNGDPAWAVEASADGVQLSESRSSVEAARSVVGESRLIGRSVHSLEGAVDAASAGADFLVLGTLYSSRSHPGGPAAGAGLVREVSDRVVCPVLGIGGIDAGNARAVLQAGAEGVAVISAILASDDPRGAARRLSDAMRPGR